eukprot:gnl/MRDRNA2_/MRDRNA2_62723_c1_seq1.p1 gnl/MRDRNA2_/MRDRNA2_62723_c1~~gnl/MRDRNA2_/MRDRNA2_62723_c1_seq1.p1  ORF type:complete len:107 (+),score=13.44 gnl/MRDRNA2_/MRDRNA2_62723_c1_seq1:22-342(+)
MLSKLPLLEEKLERCRRLQDAIDQATYYLNLTLIVQVQIDEDSEVIRCLNMGGEEIVPALHIDVTVGSLQERIRSIVPHKGFIKLVSANGMTLEDVPDEQHVKEIL